jgi:glycine/D-amino acid oxidase-like deaminating enzyme
MEVEVCVVGGGLAGVATALALAERGRSVALLEARRIGWGASGRNSGIVTSGYPVSMFSLAEQLGRSSALALWRLSTETVALVRRRAERLGSRVFHGLDDRFHETHHIGGDVKVL